jgi:organic radical activating enzyme
MAITLRTRGDLRSEDARFSARVTFTAIADLDRRQDHVLVVNTPGMAYQGADLQGYAAVIVTKETMPVSMGTANTPLMSVPSVSHLAPGHIVSIEPRSGMVLTVFRPESRHNVVFTTERCNSNCLMCSQPPKDIDDSWRVQEHMRVLSLIDTPPQFLCITGGEPTLLGDGLIQILTEIRDRLPGTSVQMLTNGRSYKNAAFAANVAAVKHPQFVSAIPLYADIAGIHDYIVQAPGAFDETVEGLYNAAEVGLVVEIRIVLHKQSIPRLVQLAEFIYPSTPASGSRRPRTYLRRTKSIGRLSTRVTKPKERGAFVAGSIRASFPPVA